MASLSGNDSLSDNIHLQVEIETLRNENATLKKTIDDNRKILAVPEAQNANNAEDMIQNINLNKAVTLSRLSSTVKQGVAAQDDVKEPAQGVKLNFTNVKEARKIIVFMLGAHRTGYYRVYGDAILSLMKDFFIKIGAVKYANTLSLKNESLIVSSTSTGVQPDLLDIVKTVGCFCAFGEPCSCL